MAFFPTKQELADQLQFIQQLRNLGALHVKVGDVDVLFPLSDAPVKEKTYARPIDDPAYLWTPSQQEPEDRWAAFKDTARPDEQ